MFIMADEIDFLQSTEVQQWIYVLGNKNGSYRSRFNRKDLPTTITMKRKNKIISYNWDTLWRCWKVDYKFGDPTKRPIVIHHCLGRDSMLTFLYWIRRRCKYVINTYEGIVELHPPITGLQTDAPFRLLWTMKAPMWRFIIPTGEAVYITPQAAECFVGSELKHIVRDPEGYLNSVN